MGSHQRGSSSEKSGVSSSAERREQVFGPKTVKCGAEGYPYRPRRKKRYPRAVDVGSQDGLFDGFVELHDHGDDPQISHEGRELLGRVRIAIGATPY